ncbi:MAG: hypothetical protein JWL75_616 [Parcubacteria group bacterium]|nr:hypothetical protein [Parcubacteria group bacterium]
MLIKVLSDIVAVMTTDAQLEKMGFKIDAVTEAVGRLILKVDGLDTKLEDLDTRFEGLDTKFENLETKVEKGFAAVGSEMQGIKTEVHELNTRVGSLETKVGDMHETLQAVEKAIDIDAVTVIDHERRLSILELANG